MSHIRISTLLRTLPHCPSVRPYSSTPPTLLKSDKWVWVGTARDRYKVPAQLSNLSTFFASPESRDQPAGNPWSARHLRLKSFSDLHSLWFILLREYNLLWTEQGMALRNGEVFREPERKKKVRKSMGAVKQVLGERKRGLVFVEDDEK